MCMSHTEQGIFSFQAFIKKSVTDLKCSQKSVKMYEESDTFLLGPDAKIHFTDTHLTIPDGGLEQFCVEQMDDHAADYGDGGDGSGDSGRLFSAVVSFTSLM